MKGRIGCILVFFVLITAAAGRRAGDSGVFVSGTENFKFGKTRIVQQIDASKSWAWPVFTLSIFHENELMAMYKDINCQKFFASPDNQYFLGVSNRGVPGTAFVIFDNQGNLIREEKHQFFTEPYYCSESVIMRREWYNEKNPQIQFVVENGRLEKLFINGCNQERYNLLNRIYLHRGKDMKGPIKEDMTEEEVIKATIMNNPEKK